MTKQTNHQMVRSTTQDSGLHISEPQCLGFWSFGTGSNKLGWYHIVGWSASSTLLLLQTTLSSFKLSLIKWGWFLIIKPTRCTNFSNLFLEWNSTWFRQFLCPSSGVFHCTHSAGISSILILLTSCQQTCMTYTMTVWTVKNFWQWTEELSESCRVSFQE